MNVLCLLYLIQQCSVHWWDCWQRYCWNDVHIPQFWRHQQRKLIYTVVQNDTLLFLLE